MFRFPWSRSLACSRSLTRSRAPLKMSPDLSSSINSFSKRVSRIAFKLSSSESFSGEVLIQLIRLNFILITFLLFQAFPVLGLFRVQCVLKTSRSSRGFSVLSTSTFGFQIKILIKTAQLCRPRMFPKLW